LYSHFIYLNNWLVPHICFPYLLDNICCDSEWPPANIPIKKRCHSRISPFSTVLSQLQCLTYYTSPVSSPMSVMSPAIVFQDQPTPLDPPNSSPFHVAYPVRLGTLPSQKSNVIGVQLRNGVSVLTASPLPKHL
jgi:hypothetical protein